MEDSLKALILITLSTIATASLLITGCGSNSNPLALPGKACPGDYQPYDPALSEAEQKANEEDTKYSQKPNFGTLPAGSYQMVTTNILLVELENGEEQPGENFKIHLVDQVPSPLTNAKTFMNNEDVVEVNGVQHFFKTDCARNVKQNKVLQDSFDAVSEFTVENNQTVSYVPITYGFHYGLGPDDKLDVSVVPAGTSPDNMDDFYKGGNQQGRSFNKAIYKVKQSDEIIESMKDIYELRSEYRSEDLLVRVRVTYRKLTAEEIAEREANEQDTATPEPSPVPEDPEA